HLDNTVAAINLSSDFLRLLAYQAVFDGQLEERIDAMDRALFPNGGHVEVQVDVNGTPIDFWYVGTDGSGAVDNTVTRDGAFMDAYALVRRDLKAAMDCGDNAFTAALCQANRTRLYLDGAGTTPP